MGADPRLFAQAEALDQKILQREGCAAHGPHGPEVRCAALHRQRVRLRQDSSHVHDAHLGWGLAPSLVRIDRSAVYLNSCCLRNFAFIFLI
jgi:hypothetical protein